MQRLLFFQAAAAILPVLVLAALVESFSYPDRKLREGDRRFTLLVLVITLMFFFVAVSTEAVALSVLLSGEPTSATESLVKTGLVANAMFLTLGPVRRTIRGGVGSAGWGCSWWSSPGWRGWRSLAGDGSSGRSPGSCCSRASRGSRGKLGAMALRATATRCSRPHQKSCRS